MSDILAHYSPEDITVLLYGVYPLQGFVAGTFLTISKNMQPYVAQRTTDGQVARLNNRDATYTISLTLHNTADANDVLSNLVKFDEITQKGKFPILIKDQLGSSLFFSTTTWIEGVPDMTFADNITERTWVLRSANASLTVGGNSDASGLLEDLFNVITGSAPALGDLL